MKSGENRVKPGQTGKVQHVPGQGAAMGRCE